jgi:hypothetical protein
MKTTEEFAELPLYVGALNTSLALRDGSGHRIPPFMLPVRSSNATPQAVNLININRMCSRGPSQNGMLNLSSENFEKTIIIYEQSLLNLL